MKSNSVPRKLGLGLAAIIVAAGVSAAAPSQAQDTMMIAKERVALMKEMGKNLGMIGKGVKGEAPVDVAAFGTAAGVISANASKLKGMFPDGTGGGETRAMAAIWEKKADFDEYFTKLADASAAFAKEAAGGSMADLKGSFGAMASNCGGCHKAYRTPKE